MSFWPFRKREAPKPPIVDGRVWNEDWKVGDIAECIVDGVNRRWHKNCQPWLRPAFGQQFIVVGFSEGEGIGTNSLRYFLKLKDWPVEVVTTAFRKVRPVATEKSEVVERILNAKPGVDRTREDA